MTNITAQLQTLEWDYQTDQAKDCCEKAFGHYRGEGTEEGVLLGISQPVYIQQRSMVPVSTYDVLRQGRFWIGGCIMEEMPKKAFTRVSRVIAASHLGNRDTLLYSAMCKLTGGSWDKDIHLYRITLKDMLIYAPYEPDEYLADLKECPDTYRAQEELGFPGFGLIVLPPPKSQHLRINQMQRAIQATEFISKWADTQSVSYRPPLRIHKP